MNAIMGSRLMRREEKELANEEKEIDVGKLDE